MAKSPAYLESLFNERGANAKTLVIRVHDERGKSDSRSDYLGRFDGDGRKHDMPDNPVTMNSDKRKFGIENPGIPQGIYETCFVIMSKRLVVYLKNCGNICRNFRPDKK
jgi:hypothetical protein